MEEIRLLYGFKERERKRVTVASSLYFFIQRSKGGERPSFVFPLKKTKTYRKKNALRKDSQVSNMNLDSQKE